MTFIHRNGGRRMGLFNRKLKIRDVANGIVDGMMADGRDAQCLDDDKITAMLAVYGRNWGMFVRVEEAMEKIHMTTATFVILEGGKNLTLDQMPEGQRNGFLRIFNSEEPFNPLYKHKVDSEGKPLLVTDGYYMNEPSNLQFIVNQAVSIAKTSDQFPATVKNIRERVSTESEPGSETKKEMPKASVPSEDMNKDVPAVEEHQDIGGQMPMFSSQEGIKESCDMITENLNKKGYNCRYGFFFSDSQEISVQSDGWSGKITISETSFDLVINVRFLYMRRKRFVLKGDMGDGDQLSITMALENIPSGTLNSDTSASFNDRGEVEIRSEGRFILDASDARDAWYTIDGITDDCTKIAELLDDLPLPGWKYTK